ncbi:MAG: TrkH family potassium uptake protein [Acutalibacteraceae bacterium]|nr:TrkH family potassium uptake protein [Acutalibacteraceae bacterium]
MNYRMIFYILGKILGTLGLLMLLPLITAALYGESILPFALPLVLCVAVGICLSLKAPKNRRLLSKDGFVCVGISWIIMSLVGCLPFIISGTIPAFVDAFFETVSGFTTTGATVIADIEAAPKGVLLWRTFTHWIGGMGVLVFLLAILPRSDGKDARFMHLMRAEVPGPTVGKIVPRISDTARVLYAIYILLTLIEFVLLALGEMNLYEALAHSLSNAGTGGFGVKNDSIASYSAYSQYVIAVFMLLFGTNLSLFYLILTGHFLKAVKSEELRWYLGIVAVGVATIFIYIYPSLHSGELAFRQAFFQVSAIITTTGFITADFELWPVFTQVVLVLLMFCGGCAGSTAGGMKVSRLLLLLKNGRREVRYITHPKAVMSIKLEGKRLDHETVRGTTSYIIMLTGIFVVSSLLIVALENCDLVTGFTAVATSLNNVGPGLSQVGPTDNFAAFSDPGKLVLCFNMLAGRLELFPILILFAPSTWKKFA